MTDTSVISQALEQHSVRRDRLGAILVRIKLLYLHGREQFSPDERGDGATPNGSISSGIALGRMIAASPMAELAKRNFEQRTVPLIEESEVLRERS